MTLLDASGETFAWRGAAARRDHAPSEVSPHLLNAIIATEDRRFYWHFGVDLQGTAAGAPRQPAAGETVQGGSSITQQVAKLICFDNTRTLERKIKEIPAALALEWKFSKNEILSIYLNRAYLGAGATGFEAASRALLRQVGGRGDPGRGGDARGPAARAVALRADQRPRPRAGARRRPSSG